jgi:hypothetical protein
MRLSLSGEEMVNFRERLASTEELVGQDTEPCAAPEERLRIAAEIDVLVARGLYGLTLPEMRYILDPKDILGDECTAETFRALKDREMHDFGEYRTRHLVLEAWERLQMK